jgi:hypothetical protein
VANATHVFWSAGEDRSVAIRRAPKSGEETVSEVSTGSVPVSLAVDAGFIYWAPSQTVGPIVRCPISGCAASPAVVLSDQSRTTALAADGTWLVWIGASDGADAYTSLGRVTRCRIDDCAATIEVLAVQTFSADGMSIALDPTDIYWVAQGRQDARLKDYFPETTIYRHAK